MPFAPRNTSLWQHCTVREVLATSGHRHHHEVKRKTLTSRACDLVAIVKNNSPCNDTHMYHYKDQSGSTIVSMQNKGCINSQYVGTKCSWTEYLLHFIHDRELTNMITVFYWLVTHSLRAKQQLLDALCNPQGKVHPKGRTWYTCATARPHEKVTIFKSRYGRCYCQSQ